MIQINQNKTADSRTCDFKNTPKEVVLQSSLQHIQDVVQALNFFVGKLVTAAGEHDYDKLTDIDGFYSDFKNGFETTTWWDNHRKIHRHHLAQEDGIPDDVNLIDILEYIADCVMAGMARTGEVTEIIAMPGLLEKAFKNTIDMLIKEVHIYE